MDRDGVARPAIVVRLNTLRDVSKSFARLRWFRENVARCGLGWEYIICLSDLLYYTNGDPAVDDELNHWQVYKNWQALYHALRLGCHYPGRFAGELPYYFRAVLYMNVRPDDHSNGMGYGREERADERLLLRACALAARGNVMILDWGICSDFPKDPALTMEHIASIYGMRAYMYEDVQVREPVVKAPNGLRTYEMRASPGFAKLVRLGHFLRPISIDVEALPEDYVRQLWLFLQRQLFSEDNLREVRWVAWWDLFYARDFLTLRHTRWTRFDHVQFFVINRYRQIRFWISSSTWIQLLGDVTSFMLATMVYNVVYQLFQLNWPIEISFAPLVPYSAWAALQYFMRTSWRDYPLADRPSVFALTKRFVSLACVSASFTSLLVLVFSSKILDTEAVPPGLANPQEYATCDNLSYECAAE